MDFRNRLLSASPLLILVLMGAAALLDLLSTRSSETMWAGFAGVSVALISVTAIVFVWKRLATAYSATAVVVGFAGFALTGAVESLGDPISIAIIGGGICLACLTGLLQAAILPKNQLVKSTETIDLPAASQFNDSVVNDSVAINESFEIVDETPEEACQTWNRFRLASGNERLEGMVTLTFEEGEQLKHFHIPISPPFTGIPTGHCELSDDAFRATFTQLQPYGARLTVKRRATHTAEETVELEIALMTTQAQRVAA